MIPNADQIEKWSKRTDDGYVKIPATIWPELLWVMRMAEDAETKLMAQKEFLRAQPCLGFTFAEDDNFKPVINGAEMECIDVVSSNTIHMCLRCRILLYMDWTHGFPRPRVAA